eukprot:gene17904-24296_t
MWLIAVVRGVHGSGIGGWHGYCNGGNDNDVGITVGTWVNDDNIDESLAAKFAREVGITVGTWVNDDNIDESLAAKFAREMARSLFSPDRQRNVAWFIEDGDKGSASSSKAAVLYRCCMVKDLTDGRAKAKKAKKARAAKAKAAAKESSEISFAVGSTEPSQSHPSMHADYEYITVTASSAVDTTATWFFILTAAPSDGGGGEDDGTVHASSVRRVESRVEEDMGTVWGLRRIGEVESEKWTRPPFL